jgi:REP element-mobilizing transposase RayT
VVDRQIRLGDAEREQMVRLMRKYEAFGRLQVLTYCIMGNHLHILVAVDAPPAEVWSDAQLLEHLEACAHPQLKEVSWRLNHFRDIGAHDAADELRGSFLKRMWDVSFFMKGIKQEFTQWFNRRHERTGTLWESRFKSVMVEGKGAVLETMAAYIDLNPLRAGLVDDPKDYRWCGYAEAVAGGKLARMGLCEVVGVKPGEWRDGLAEYRKMVFLGAEPRGVSETGAPLRRGVSHQRIQEVLDKKGRLSLAQTLLCRIRYFSDAAVLGSREFVESIFEAHRERFGPNRQTGARPCRLFGLDGVFSLRDLQSP